MSVGAAFQERIDSWDSLSRWERSELGRDLRRLELSYGEIVDLIPVEKSTLATWCREVKLTEEQVAALKVRRPPLPGILRDTQRKRHREIEMIRAQARLEAIHLQDDPFWAMGVASTGEKEARRAGDLRWRTQNRALSDSSYVGRGVLMIQMRTLPRH